MIKTINYLELILATISFFTLSLKAEDQSNYRKIFTPLPKNAFLPEDLKGDQKVLKSKVALGKKLYMDPLLSKTGKLSCNTCHQLENFGVDNEATSKGHNGKRGERNSPTVYNAALHFVQFWDGRALTVEEQALGPIMNPAEMGLRDSAELEKKISEINEYKKLFKNAFPLDNNPINSINIAKAIGTFERTLIAPAKFDLYLQGGNNLTKKELNGLSIFVNSGCIACHNGTLLGGNMYQKLGLVVPYATYDLGRYKVTKNESDKYFFKVPSLRNITKTAPYFHDGSIKTLPEAITLMGKHQLGKDLTSSEVKSIILFLNTLQN
jgi:cytochrome c peroxidase